MHLKHDKQDRKIDPTSAMILSPLRHVGLSREEAEQDKKYAEVTPASGHDIGYSNGDGNGNGNDNGDGCGNGNGDDGRAPHTMLSGRQLQLQSHEGPMLEVIGLWKNHGNDGKADDCDGDDDNGGYCDGDRSPSLQQLLRPRPTPLQSPKLGEAALRFDGAGDGNDGAGNDGDGAGNGGKEGREGSGLQTEDQQPSLTQR
jgi:hypothetical protein